VGTESTNIPGSLLIDENTLRDLEVFKSETGGTCLFDVCNLTRTEGGRQALRRRMRLPWSTAAQIRSTQSAISFVLGQRQAFEKLPSAYVSNIVSQHYLREILPIITEENPIAFGVGVFGVWANRDSHHFIIVRGVQMTCLLLTTLRKFIAQPELLSASGEMASFVDEIRALLDRPALCAVPDKPIGSWLWKILRFDQVFRLHEKASLDRLIEIISEIDALTSMADVTSDCGFALPHIEEGALCVHAENLVHPLLTDAVANPLGLSQKQRTLFLTGPNMAGKTTYLRATALALLLAQMGMGVPASKFRFAPAQYLFTSISLSDDLSGGVSYFRAEALRVKAVALAVSQGYRVMALMDEPFKGTNVRDAIDASSSIIVRFSTKANCLFIFSSHLIELSEQLQGNAQVDCRCFKAEEHEGRLRFDYQLHPGVSSQRLGMRVLQEEGIFDLLDSGQA